jgi:hypothetical protein
MKTLHYDKSGFVSDLKRIDLKLLNRQQDLMNERLNRGEMSEDENRMIDGLNYAIDALRNAALELNVKPERRQRLLHHLERPPPVINPVRRPARREIVRALE